MPDFEKANSRPATRIDADIEQVRRFVTRANEDADRIIAHAHALGYFAPPDATDGRTPTAVPVTTTLADALRDLDRALERIDSALNLFH